MIDFKKLQDEVKEKYIKRCPKSNSTGKNRNMGSKKSKK
jgi:hypothetical protein